MGLDIGSSRTKVVVLHRRRGRTTLKQAVVAATPITVMANGEFTNSILIADHLRAIRKSYGIRPRRVAVSAAGEKVFAHCETLPKDFDGNYSEAVRAAAERMLPYPLDAAILDYQPLDAAPGGGKRLVWASAATQQVEWLREAVSLAGNTAAIIDVEACALANSFAYNYRAGGDSKPCILLHIGERSLNVCLLEAGIPLFSETVMLERHKMAQKPESLSDRISAELRMFWDRLRRVAKPYRIEKLYLSGGGAHERAITATLRHDFDLPVEEFDPFREINYSPSSYEGTVVREYGPSLSVAVGLALRSFEAL